MPNKALIRRKRIQARNNGLVYHEAKNKMYPAAVLETEVKAEPVKAEEAKLEEKIEKTSVEEPKITKKAEKKAKISSKKATAKKVKSVENEKQ